MQSTENEIKIILKEAQELHNDIFLTADIKEVDRVSKTLYASQTALAYIKRCRYLLKELDDLKKSE